MGSAAPVRGGPRDGEYRTSGSLGEFWDAQWGGEWYVYRLVVRRVGRAEVGVWEYLGDDAHRCLGCYSVVEVPRGARCPLCGATGAEVA